MTFADSGNVDMSRKCSCNLWDDFERFSSFDINIYPSSSQTLLTQGSYDLWQINVSVQQRCLSHQLYRSGIVWICAVAVDQASNRQAQYDRDLHLVALLNQI